MTFSCSDRYYFQVMGLEVIKQTLETLMDLIHYSFAPLILFCVPYMLDFLLYYLSIANGAGGVGIFELLVFHCFV